MSNAYLKLQETGLGTILALQGNTGGEITPDGSGVIYIVGGGAASSGVSSAGSFVVSGDLPSSTLQINATQAQFISNYTDISFADSPYVVLDTDYYISIDTSAGAVTIQLPDAPTTNRTLRLKDRTGDANTFNITVTTVSGVVTIDGATSYVMEGNYESSSFIYNGTSYETF